MRKFILLLLASLSTAAQAAHESCADCHTGAAPSVSDLSLSVPALCLQCHPDRVAPSEHRIDVAPIRAVSLPLVNGRVSCTTCHDAHLKTPGATRLETPQLCTVCHSQ